MAPEENLRGRFARQDERDRERMRRVYRRNFILMFLSLTVAVVALAVTRFCVPLTSIFEGRPVAGELEKSVRGEFPNEHVRVRLIEDGGDRIVEVEVTFSGKVGDTDPIVARIENTIFQEWEHGEDLLVARIYEEREGEAALISISRTKINEIKARMETETVN